MKQWKFSLRLLLIVTAILAVAVAFNRQRIANWLDTKENGDLMSLKKFWGTIDASWENAQTDAQFRNNLTKKLDQLSERELQRFGDRYFERYYLAYDGRLWDAIYLINGGCSDDSFMDFRDYLISRGRDVYDRTLKDPETLLDDRLSGGEWPEWSYSEEHFGQIANDIAESKNFKQDVSNLLHPGQLYGHSINTSDDYEIKKHYPRIYLHLKSENEKRAALREARKAAKENAK